jgi:hypothetical protein
MVYLDRVASICLELRVSEAFSSITSKPSSLAASAATVDLPIPGGPVEVGVFGCVLGGVGC